MLRSKKINYNNFFPLKVWITTLFIGTTLHVLSSNETHLPASNHPFLVELLIAFNYSLFTLVVCYIVFLGLLRTELKPLYIKIIIAVTGCICCIGTIMHKFNFGFSEFGKDGYWSIITSFCLPLIISSFLIRLKESKTPGY